MKEKGSNKKLEGHKSISYKEMLDFQKNGLQKEWRTGNRTWPIRKRENRANSNLNTNKPKNSMK